MHPPHVAFNLPSSFFIFFECLLPEGAPCGNVSCFKYKVTFYEHILNFKAIICVALLTILGSVLSKHKRDCLANKV